MNRHCENWDSAAVNQTTLSEALGAKRPIPLSRHSVEMPTGTEATLEVYDIMGRRVARVASRLFAAGTSTVEWNSAGLGKGLYFGRLSSEGHFATIPLIIQ